MPRPQLSSSDLAADRDWPVLAQFRESVPHDLCRRRQIESRHQGSDQEIGPGGAGREHAASGEQHGQIPGDIIAAAEPHRAHIGIAATEPEQQGGTAEIGSSARNPIKPMVNALGTRAMNTR